MKKKLALTVAFTAVVSLCAFAAPINLPNAQRSGGMPLFEALSKRSSAGQRNFRNEALTPQELSTILWAATGKNREPKGWTVPMAMGREPYVSIYVLLESGAYLYSWEEHALLDVNSDRNILRRAASQNFAKTAPCILIFAKNGGSGGNEFAELAAGAMSQNAYLAATSLGINARFVASVDRAAVEASLAPVSASDIIGAMLIGRQ